MLTRPLDPELIAAEIRKYNVNDVKLVSDRVRREAGLTSAVDEWIELYHDVLAEHSENGSQHAQELAALADYVAEWGIRRKNYVGESANRTLSVVAHRRSLDQAMVQEIAAEIKPLLSWPWFAGHCQSQSGGGGVVLDRSQDRKHV